MTRMEVAHILQPNDDIGPASHRVIIGEHPRQDGFEAILTRMFCKNSLERCLMSLVVLAFVLAIATCEKSSGISKTAIGLAPVVLQADTTTFIWGNQAAAQSASERPASAFNSIPAASINRFWNEPSQLELQRQPQARRDRIAAARGRVAVRGRLAATQRAVALVDPLGFDISKTFDAAYKRGQVGDSSLIHIDLPIQQFQIAKTVGGGKKELQANFQPRNIDGTALPSYLRLNKVEAATLKEEKTDPGGVTRLRAMGSHFAHRIDKVLGSIHKKLTLAEQWRKDHHVPNALSQLQAIDVGKTDRKAWAQQMQDLDDVISAHGGDPPPEDSSMMQARRDMNAEKQQMYQDALRRAFGRNPTLPVP